MSISVYQSAGLVPYSNAISGLVATQVQAAIDELAGTLGTAILQDGNSFGENIVIGTNDNFQVNIETNGVQIAAFTPTGKLVLGSTTEYDPFAEDKLNILSSSDGSAQVFLQRNDLTLDNAVGGFENQGAMIFGVNAVHETGTYANLYGVYGNVFQDSTGNIDNAYGVFFECVKINSAGLLTNAYGINAAVRKIGADGKIRNAYGLYIAATHATGTDAGQTHTAAGVYIPSGAILASGGDTNNAYTVLSLDPDVKAAFIGPMYVGATQQNPLIELILGAVNSDIKSYVENTSSNTPGIFTKVSMLNFLYQDDSDPSSVFTPMLNLVVVDEPTSPTMANVNAMKNIVTIDTDSAVITSVSASDTILYCSSNPTTAYGQTITVHPEGFSATASLGMDLVYGLELQVSNCVREGNTTADERLAVGINIGRVASRQSTTSNVAIGLYFPAAAIVTESDTGTPTNTNWVIKSEDTSDSQLAGPLILGDDVRDPLNDVNENLVVADSFNGDGSKTLQYNKLTLTGTADGGGAYYALLSDINLDHTTGEYTSVNAFLNRAIHNSTGNIDTLILNDSSFVTASVGSVGTTGAVVGISVSIGNDQGILRNAYGLRIFGLAAQGTDPGETHQAIGIYIPSGAIVASGGAVNNEYAILIEDDADSYMEGKLITNTGIELSASSPGNTLLSHYQEVAESNLGTLTWTAGTAPSGSINKKYKATRIGNRVDLWCRIEAATPGATVTAVSFPLPSDAGINTPVAFTGMGNGEFNVPGSGAITVGGALPTAGPCNAYLGKDGGGVWTVYITGPSSSADTAFCHISYFV